MIIKETSDIKGKIFTHLFIHFYRYRKPNAYYKLWLKNIWFPVAIKMYETSPSKTIWIFSGLFNAFIYHFIYFFYFLMRQDTTSTVSECIQKLYKCLQYINGHHSSNTPTNHLAIELQHISKKYPILSVFYRYQKRFKYHILAHIANHCL